MSIETLVKPYVAVSGLLAEVMLFVLVGATVDVRYTLSADGRTCWKSSPFSS